MCVARYTMSQKIIRFIFVIRTFYTYLCSISFDLANFGQKHTRRTFAELQVNNS